MTVALEHTVLLWDPDDPKRFGVDPHHFEALGMQTLCVPYHQLGQETKLIDNILETKADALVFTRNDDMKGFPPIGEILSRTRMGYSCISAIDPAHQENQTRACVKDFLSQNGVVELPDIPKIYGPANQNRAKNGTFTLVFDMEQLGGVRFGLPRLLKYIEPLGIRATFFVTGIVASIYPNVLERLSITGHEIAIHGSVHEFFTDRDFEEQLRRLSDHLNQLKRFSDVKGANLIYRMDSLTVRAMTSVGIDYFVLFRKHVPYRSRYLRPSTRCRRFRASESSNDLTFIPISVETYQGDSSEIIRSIDSAWKTSQQEGTNHISILMHPFKDGSLKRMDLTRKIIQYVMEHLNLSPVTLNQLPSPPDVPENVAQIHYRWDGCPAPDTAGSISNLTRSWWHPIEYHALRTERLVDALEQENCPAMLSAGTTELPSHISIFPDIVTDADIFVKTDPLCFVGSATRLIKAVLGNGVRINLYPANKFTDIVNFCLFHLPRNTEEFLLVMRKILMRIRLLLPLGKYSDHI